MCALTMALSLDQLTNTTEKGRGNRSEMPPAGCVQIREKRGTRLRYSCSQSIQAHVHSDPWESEQTPHGRSSLRLHFSR